MANLPDDLGEILPEIRIKPVIRRHYEVADFLESEASETIDNEFLIKLRKWLSNCEQYPLSDKAETHLGVLLSSFSGRKVTPQTVDALAWRLAACYETLAEGNPPKLSFEIEHKPEWTALSIVSSCFLRLSRTMKPLLDVQFRVLSGPYGGLQFRQQIPHTWVTSKLGRELGGGTREHRYPDHRELGGFLLVGKLDTWQPETPRLADFRATSACLNYNRDLKKVRKQACPLKFTHECHECWVGTLQRIPPRFGPSRCSGARRDAKKAFDLLPRPAHPLHYVTRRCTYCKKDDAAFEPSQQSRYCVSCQCEFIRTYRRF
jgi:hypothetical protein